MKFLPGPITGAASGSVGGTTFSHNRFGQYTRNRAIPVKAQTQAAINAKARLQAASQSFQTLTAAEQEAWRQFALTNPVVDALGQQQALTGHQAYVGNYTRMASDALTPLTVPPISAAPLPLLTLSLTADIGSGTFDATYTATPLGADDKLWVRGAIVDSAGIRYVENLLRFLGTSSAAQASPFTVQTMFSTRFGTLQVGQTVHIRVGVFDSVTGLLSASLASSAVITDTP